MTTTVVHTRVLMGKEKVSKAQRIATVIAKAVKAMVKEDKLAKSAFEPILPIVFKQDKVAKTGGEPQAFERPESPISVASTWVSEDTQDQHHPTAVDVEHEMGALSKEYADPKWVFDKQAKQIRRFPSEAYWLKKREHQRNTPSSIFAVSHQVKSRDPEPLTPPPKIQSLWSQRRRRTGGDLAVTFDPRANEPAANAPLAAVTWPAKPTGPPPARRSMRPSLAGQQFTHSKEGLIRAVAVPDTPAPGAATTPLVAPAPCSAELAGVPQKVAAAAVTSSGPKKPDGPSPLRHGLRPNCAGRQITRGNECRLVLAGRDAGPGSLARASQARAAVVAATAASGDGAGKRASESLAGAAGLALLMSVRKRQ